MSKKYVTVGKVAIVATMALTTYAWGACNIATDANGDPVTGASNAFELSGQGNFSCADLNMFEITGASVTLSGDGKQVDFWKTTEEADAVVVDPSNGNRCAYIYPDQATSGQFLTPGSNKTVSDVVVCSDGRDGLVAAEKLTLPITTAENSCSATVTYVDPETGSVSETFSDGGVVTGESIDGQTVAACNTGETQNLCVDACFDFRDTSQVAACQTYEQPLDICKPCLLASDAPELGALDPPQSPPEDGVRFCWEYVNSVCDYSIDPNCSSSDGGTLIPHKPIRQSETTTTWYNKCSKTKVSLNGVDYTVTTCK